MGEMYFVFAETVLEMAFLFDEFLDLVSESNVGQEKTAVLLVVVVFCGVLVAGLRKGVRLKIVLKVEVHYVNKIVKIYINFAMSLFLHLLLSQLL